MRGEEGEFGRDSLADSALCRRLELGFLRMWKSVRRVSDETLSAEGQAYGFLNMVMQMQGSVLYDWLHWGGKNVDVELALSCDGEQPRDSPKTGKLVICLEAYSSAAIMRYHWDNFVKCGTSHGYNLFFPIKHYITSIS